MSLLGWMHVSGAVAALLCGAFVFGLPKGTRRHRQIGRLYALALLLVNVAALLLFRATGHWGPFHTLAVISLSTLAVGTLPLVFGHRGPAVIARHGYFLAWSYAGLVAAGVAQATQSWLSGGIWRAVIGPALVIVAIGAITIHTLMPRTLQALATIQHHEAAKRRRSRDP